MPSASSASGSTLRSIAGAAARSGVGPVTARCRTPDQRRRAPGRPPPAPATGRPRACAGSATRRQLQPDRGRELVGPASGASVGATSSRSCRRRRRRRRTLDHPGRQDRQLVEQPIGPATSSRVTASVVGVMMAAA
jgi:hypothetical protein